MSNSDLENFKNLKTIWKNTYDKILELKVMKKIYIIKQYCINVYIYFF